MKQIFMLALVVLLFSCNSETKDAGTSTETKIESTSDLQYAYNLKGSPNDNWDRGDQKNVVLVLNCLKAYENNKIDEAISYFADSVQFAADGIDGKFSKDSLKAIMQTQRNSVKSLEIQMEDFESVISKDKKREYVSLWYKEKWTDNNGAMDSIFYMDDVRVSNGKILSIDEKARKYPRR